VNKFCTNKTQLFIKFTKLSHKLCSSVKYTAIIPLFLFTGPRSLQIEARDEQIAHPSGEGLLSVSYFGFSWPSIASPLTVLNAAYENLNLSLSLSFSGSKIHSFMFGF